MEEEQFITCPNPNCSGTVRYTIKGAAIKLATEGQGYASVVYAHCPTCGSLLLAKLEWTPVIVSVKLAGRGAQPGLLWRIER